MKSQVETYTGYMVEMLVSKHWLVAWQSSKGTTLVFHNETEALDRIVRHLREWRKAVAVGIADEVPQPSQFRIVEVEVKQKLKRRRRKK